MQEQKAENTGRQFCSCFYQLLGIGGPEARPCQDASWGVRVGTYVSLAYHLHHHLFLPFSPLALSLFLSFPLRFFSSRSLAVPFLLLLLFLFSSLANLSVFSIWAGSTIRSSLASTSLRSLLASLAHSSSSSSLAAFGYHLGHRGHPPQCTRYVVCPIFTHGKSTLKRRWAPARSSSLSSPRTPSSLPLFSYAISAASQ